MSLLTGVCWERGGELFSGDSVLYKRQTKIWNINYKKNLINENVFFLS